MSIGELAKETYSSNASIIRICKKLGYKGFRDFKMDYLREMESLKYVNNDIDFSFPFNSDEPTWQIINSLSSMYKESIDLINGELDIDELEKIVDLLDRSNRVFVYAIGDSRISAMGFTNKLIKIGKFFYIVTDNDDEVKEFIINKLGHSATIIDARGGYSNKKNKIIMATIPTKEYFIVKEFVQELDKNSFFLITDTYEVSGGR